MTRAAAWVAATLAAGCAAPAAPDEDLAFATVVEGLVGLRDLDDDFEPVEEHVAIGLGVVHLPAGWPVELEAALQYSEADDLVFRSELVELSVGLRKTLPLDGAPVALYGGAGAAWLWGDLDVAVPASIAAESDASIGGYVHVGFVWMFAPGTTVGLDLRMVRGTELDLGSVEGDADYRQIALVFGYGV